MIAAKAKEIKINPIFGTIQVGSVKIYKDDKPIMRLSFFANVLLKLTEVVLTGGAIVLKDVLGDTHTIECETKISVNNNKIIAIPVIGEPIELWGSIIRNGYDDIMCYISEE